LAVPFTVRDAAKPARGLLGGKDPTGGSSFIVCWPYWQP
jgi:hypothetical protein